MVLNDGEFTTEQQYRAYSLHLCNLAVSCCIYHHCIISVESRAVVITVVSLDTFVTLQSNALTVFSYCHTMLY
jgi:hypothetical protein